MSTTEAFLTIGNILFLKNKTKNGADEMVQQIKVLATKPNGLNSVPKTTYHERANVCVMPSDLHLVAMACVPTHIKVHTQ